MGPPSFRDYTKLKSEKFNEECYPTLTTREQIKTETSIDKKFNLNKSLYCENPEAAHLNRDKHENFLREHFLRLPSAFACLDSSRPWIAYWTLNAASLLNYKFSDVILDGAIEFLIKCRNPCGGFGGGPGQYSHLATTYGAVNSLCIIGTPKAYEAISRDTLKQFLWSVREPDGAFRLHVGGENDIRGAYCAISCAKLCNFTKEEEASLFEGTGDWIASCQTYEGGFGGAPDLEAHGGYTFCGIAALAMLGCTDKCNINDVMKWALFRQMKFEGGFQGRTNKLVDGCYSFWVGAIIPIAQALIANNNPRWSSLLKECLFDRSALQEYILLCCQCSYGGLIDKPGKPADPYHTCYTLSGVSVAQHANSNMEPLVLGNLDNELLPTHPLHNIPPKAVLDAYNYFSGSVQEMSQDEEEEESSNIYESSRSPSREPTAESEMRESSVETALSTSEYDESEGSYPVNTSKIVSG